MKRAQPGQDWTCEEDEIIYQGLGARLNMRAIAERLPARTRNSVIGRVHRHPDKFAKAIPIGPPPEILTDEPLPPPPPKPKLEFAATGKRCRHWSGGKNCANTRLRHTVHGLCSIHETQRIRAKRKGRIESGELEEFRLSTRGGGQSSIGR